MRNLVGFENTNIAYIFTFSIILILCSDKSGQSIHNRILRISPNCGIAAKIHIAVTPTNVFDHTHIIFVSLQF
jgi:hypothetical protein